MIYRMQLADSVDEMIFDLLEVPIEDKDIEGTADNTTIDGNVFTDYLWLKKQFVQKWSLMCEDDYTQLRGFYTRQWENAEVPTYKLFVGENRSETLTASGSAFQIQNGTQYDAPLTLAELKGNATQTTYSGKNLLNKNVGFTNKWINSNGVEVAGNTNALFNGYIKVAPNTAYTLSFKSRVYNMIMSEWNESKTFVKQNIKSASTSYTITTQATTEYLRVNFNYNGSTTVTQDIIDSLDIQLELGSTATAYEPYVGGTASPNPDYPQAVNTTTGENVVKITGKNLFDNAKLAKGSVVFSEGVATGTAQQFYSAWNNTDGLLDSYPTQLTITAEAYTDGNDSTTSTGLRIRVIYTDNTSDYASWPNNTASYTLASITTNANKTIKRVVFSYNSSASNIWHVKNVQLELGSTATAYEPYQGQDYEVNLGKNLLENTHATGSTTTNGMTFTVNSDGTITLNGTATALTWFVFRPAQLDLPDGTYTISLQGGTDGDIGVYNDKFGNTALGSSTTRTITSASGNVSLRVASGATASNLTVKPMIERGTQATTYAPYFTPIELAKIGNYQDRIYKSDGKWYVEKQVGKATFDGSTESGWQAGAGNRMFFRNDSDYALAEDNDHIGAIMSDNFTPQTYSDVYYGNVDYGMALAGSANRLSIRNKDCADLTAFKTWLASNPTTVYYALATPTTTEITDSTLLSQLNFIANLYGGTNNIMLVGTGAQGEIGVEYTLTYEKEQVIIPETPVRLNLTDGGVINTCGCRQNVQLTMRETVQ